MGNYQKLVKLGLEAAAINCIQKYTLMFFLSKVYTRHIRGQMHHRECGSVLFLCGS